MFARLCFLLRFLCLTISRRCPNVIHSAFQEHFIWLEKKRSGYNMYLFVWRNPNAIIRSAFPAKHGRGGKWWCSVMSIMIATVISVGLCGRQRSGFFWGESDEVVGGEEGSGASELGSGDGGGKWLVGRGRKSTLAKCISLLVLLFY